MCIRDSNYSTSFGAGTRLLGRQMRTHIRSIYAMVRVADEIVDTYRGDDAGAMLDGFEREVSAALDSSYSANLVAQAFAVGARHVGIGRNLTEPFFTSMRMDLDTTEHTPVSYTHLRAHETKANLVCRLLLEK